MYQQQQNGGAETWALFSGKRCLQHDCGAISGGCARQGSRWKHRVLPKFRMLRCRGRLPDRRRGWLVTCLHFAPGDSYGCMRYAPFFEQITTAADTILTRYTAYARTMCTVTIRCSIAHAADADVQRSSSCRLNGAGATHARINICKRPARPGTCVTGEKMVKLRNDTGKIARACASIDARHAQMKIGVIQDVRHCMLVAYTDKHITALLCLQVAGQPIMLPDTDIRNACNRLLHTLHLQLSV